MLQGSMVALVTPMKPDGSVDYQALEQLINWHIKSGSQAILVLGTTGEVATITDEERLKIIHATVAAVNNTVPVIVGTGSNCTSKAIAWTQQAKELGADVVMLVTPYYNRPTQEGLYQHYKAIAEAVSLPQILYNVPSRTSCDLLPETVLRLAKLDNIVALKETVNDPIRWRKILEQSDLALFSGSDGEAYDLLKAGGHGVISVVANVVPSLFCEMCQAVSAGDMVRAAELNNHMQPLYDALFVETNPIPTKWALHKMGWIDDGIRLPLTWLRAQHWTVVDKTIKRTICELQN